MPVTENTGNRPTAVVVDGYSAGNFYPRAFAELGADVLHVQSTADLMPTLSPPRLSEYALNVVCADGDMESLVQRLKPYAPVCVVAGQDGAVTLADHLGEALGVPSNGTLLTRARRDKYEMIEALRRAGVRCADQFKSADPRAVAAWAAERDSYPVVVKPLSSAASDGVSICGNAEDVRRAAEEVLATPDIFGKRNREILVQSYLSGTEYIVDTVSADGVRYTCDVWRYEKSLLPNGKNIYNRDLLVDGSDELVAELTAYVDEVLAALDVRWGPAHAEVIMTPDGPALVEIGTRLSGHIDADFNNACLGHNQAALTALAFLQPETFQQRYGHKTYSRLRPAAIYEAPTTLDGTVTAVDEDVVAEIRALDSVHDVTVKLKPGDRITPTVGLLTSVLRVLMSAPDEHRLTSDYEKVRSLKDSVYHVAG
ncbi:ATP-grasp domain-containing protein [Streptomyces sp. CSDS2]|uniref:ATP-grasp domain-containing protein n=1 Tax=Streptomyces sp. CSDS2 TaxID=3055051 RepID=UPI0025B07AD9|nr:ATP-grasp domain-containing protein [Streptomyces sp. CSDS2]MDN3259385.1 ATP-grasp domain-containing protein [Streptomyces sp. CSDS2]